MECYNCEDAKLNENHVCTKCKLRLCRYCEERMYDHYEDRMCYFCDEDYCQVCTTYLSELTDFAEVVLQQLHNCILKRCKRNKCDMHQKTQ